MCFKLKFGPFTECHFPLDICSSLWSVYQFKKLKSNVPRVKASEISRIYL